MKKNDSVLHGIQAAISKSTRPIDYYVLCRLQENPGIFAENPQILFVNIKRVLLSDIAATANKGRLDSLKKGMKLPGKPIRPVELVFGAEDTADEGGVNRIHYKTLCRRLSRDAQVGKDQTNMQQDESRTQLRVLGGEQRIDGEAAPKTTVYYAPALTHHQQRRKRKMEVVSYATLTEKVKFTPGKEEFQNLGADIYIQDDKLDGIDYFTGSRR
ncbi:hypothetical protein AYI70_g657 [Smittium culicis]|uniref:Uncharacterized protein n=1 Tax=Smittium culicis TaxID=133412 RepID=A0A1R1YFW9_9FUNG|nr:hypothetical protein AYI70_g657 [Smittium culicis]